jgi:hypothetical protein
MHDTVIYLGPSLPLRIAQSLLNADYRPPIRRGDLAHLDEGVKAVGIIDGEFFQNLAVSTKEILPLLSRGVRVYGAASMGALRASEAQVFGMIGIGEIFAMYRDGLLDGDDEVAVMYDPETFRSLSDPMVNIRRAVELAAGANVTDDFDRESIIRQMKALYFPNRSFKQLRRLSPSMSEFLDLHPAPDLKAEDARRMLLEIAQRTH